MIHSTMSEAPLTLNAILRHGRRVHAGSECVTFDGRGVRRAMYGEVADNADRLGGALQRLGMEPGNAVGTFMWNDQEHLEAYFAVPCWACPAHPEHPAVGRAADLRRQPRRGPCRPRRRRPRAGDRAGRRTAVDRRGLGRRRRLRPRRSSPPAGRSTATTSSSPPRSPASTTRSRTSSPPPACATRAAPRAIPKASCTRTARRTCTPSPRARRRLGSSRRPVLAIVPQFHASGWGLPYAAFLSGASLLMPGRFLQAEPLSRFIAAERPTVSAAVPTVWADVFRSAMITRSTCRHSASSCAAGRRCHAR